MALTLLLMRHGKSSWDDAGLGDFDRPLTRRGKSDSVAIGEALMRRGVRPDVIVSSPAKRAQSTAKRVAKGCEHDGEIDVAPALYGGSVRDYVLAACLHGDCDVVMVIGHNPTIEDTVLRLTGVPVRVTTANVLCIDLPISGWSELVSAPQGTLRFVLEPKALTFR